MIDPSGGAQDDPLASAERAAVAFMVATYRAMGDVDAPEPQGGVHELLQRGLPGTAPQVLVTEYQVPLRTVAEWLDTSTKTLSRRSRSAHLGRTEGDLALRYGRIFEQARRAFGSDEGARTWLKSAQPALGGAIPVDLLRTELGARHVERVLDLVDYGDYL
jgi:putative toxin-antitoxin system antitoxin component (TIGR02293 family)